MKNAWNKKKCDVTRQKMAEVICDTEESNCAGVLMLNTNYGEPCDAINTETGRDYIVLSKELFAQTLNFWRELPNFNPSKQLQTVIDRYNSEII